MTRKDNRVHPTTDQKKVSVVHSKGHKPNQSEIVMQNGKEAIRKAGKILTTVGKFVVDPLNISGAYEKFKRDLVLTADENKTLDKIKKATEENFTDVYKLIPKVKNDEVAELLKSIVSLQELYFEKLNNLDFQSPTLDEQIESISSKYEKEFELFIQSHIKEMSKGNTLNINSLHKLIDLNKNTIESFKENIHDLKKARHLTKTAYSTAVKVTIAACLGIAMIVLGSLLIASTAGIPCYAITAAVQNKVIGGALLLGFGIDTFIISTFMVGIFETKERIVTVPKITAQHLESRKGMFDKLQLNLFQTCTTLRNFIAANEPKLKAS